MNPFDPNVNLDIFNLLLVMGVLTIIIWLLFAATVQRTLKLIAPENRCILPHQAWFAAIPFFNIYWNFELVKRLTYSLNNEFFDRKIAVEENPTQRWGMLYAWTFLLAYIPFPAVFLLSLKLVNFVYFVTYWIKVNQMRKLIIEHNKFLDSHINH